MKQGSVREAKLPLTPSLKFSEKVLESLGGLCPGAGEWIQEDQMNWGGF